MKNERAEQSEGLEKRKSSTFFGMDSIIIRCYILCYFFSVQDFLLQVDMLDLKEIKIVLNTNTFKKEKKN